MRRPRYKRAILRVLETAPQPLDVERIRVKCRIGNWQTALKHCLELLLEGRIQGSKTSKSWVFWNRHTKHSPPSIGPAAKPAKGFGGDPDD